MIASCIRLPAGNGPAVGLGGVAVGHCPFSRSRGPFGCTVQRFIECVCEDEAATSYKYHHRVWLPRKLWARGHFWRTIPFREPLGSCFLRIVSRNAMVTAATVVYLVCLFVGDSGDVLQTCLNMWHVSCPTGVLDCYLEMWPCAKVFCCRGQTYLRANIDWWFCDVRRPICSFRNWGCILD